MATSPLRPELLARLRAIAGDDLRAAATLRAITGGAIAEEGAPRFADQRAPFGIDALDAMLREATLGEAGGLPAGVVELAAPEGLGRATQLALRACAAAQRAEAARAGAARAGVDCAWVDASRSLYAPGVAQQGVDLARLLVVHPPPEDIARTAVRLAASGLFSRIVVDRVGVPGASFSCRHIRWNTAVRRLALAAESHETTILLLSDLEQARRDPLPVAMRIESTRPEADRLSLRIVKERRGRIPPPCVLSLSDLTR
jgi:recombination protein RecA